MENGAKSWASRGPGSSALWAAAATIRPIGAVNHDYVIELPLRTRRARCSERRYGNRPGLDLTEDEAGPEPCHAREARKSLLMDPFEVREIASEHGEQVVVLSRHQLAADDGWRSLHGGFERLEPL